MTRVARFAALATLGTVCLASPLSAAELPVGAGLSAPRAVSAPRRAAVSPRRAMFDRIAYAAPVPYVRYADMLILGVAY